MNFFSSLFARILSFPKSLYVSIRLCGFRLGFKVPVRIHYSTKLGALTGRILLIGENKCLLYIARKSDFPYDHKSSYGTLSVEGTILLHGHAYFGAGSKVFVLKDGILELGDNVVATAKMTVICAEHITFGHDIAASWNTLVMDTDFHPIYNIQRGITYPIQKSVSIGDNVWLCTRSVVLKGSEIPNGCIVAAGSVVKAGKYRPDSLLEGVPASCKKEGITFKRTSYLKFLQINSRERK